MLDADKRPTPSSLDIASWCLAAAALLLVLWLRLLSAMLAGFLVYELVHFLAPLLQRHVAGQRARLAAVVVVAVAVVGLLIAAVLGTVAFFHSDTGNLSALFEKMAGVLEESRPSLPAWLANALPPDSDSLRDALTHQLHEHAHEFELAGKAAGHVLARILIGMVIGALVSLSIAPASHASKPLAQALMARLRRLGAAFRSVVFAQVRISAINTLLTALYIEVLLRLLGIHLPLSKTLIAVTFLAGLIPIVGNLFSNTVIVIVSLAVSPQVALCSLVFLVAIHKLEYFLNAHIVGSHIQARAWELLLAMLTMEAAFGLPGLVAAPIYYAYLKSELVDQGLV